jgi:hypothetical protein
MNCAELHTLCSGVCKVLDAPEAFDSPKMRAALGTAAERIAAAVVAGEVTLEEFLLGMSVQEPEVGR